ncbi:amidohydrolase family protein [Rhodanobacter sp. DHB23]|nr:amidohydrolase family protein [Rhodanobacter sp. DHB23]
MSNGYTIPPIEFRSSATAPLAAWKLSSQGNSAVKRSLLFGATLLASVSSAHAAPGNQVAYRQPVIAFTHATIVDGTGGAPAYDQTLVIDKGRIAELGPASGTAVPAGATVIDARGKTLLPGLVMMHEHLFYTTGNFGGPPFVYYTPMPHTFPPLYLAGGETTIRTTGSMMPYADVNVRNDITAGKRIGPDIDVTGPYLNGAESLTEDMHVLADAADATRTVDYWAGEGVTSFKAYDHITRAELKAAIDAAHAHHDKITGHLCSVTYREAADLGIDNLEHGFFVASDFVNGKQPDECPGYTATFAAAAGLDPDSPAVESLIKLLVAKHVALTSTLAVFETGVAGQPQAPEAALALLNPPLREHYEKMWLQRQTQKTPFISKAVFHKLGQLEKRFVEAGGLLMGGSDPTGYGGVVPGFSSKRELELLVQIDGFTVPQAVEILSLNAAKFEGRAKEIGSLAVGKRADIVVINGDPAKDVSAIEHMPLVFKDGIGYDTAAIFKSMQGAIGMN